MVMQRGLDSHQEQDPRQLIRDTRTLGRRVFDFFAQPKNVMVVLFTMGVSVFFFPAVADLCAIVGGGMFTFVVSQKMMLPFRMPLRSGLMDPNDPSPGTGKPRKANGITFFGNEKSTGKELWFTNDDMRTHVLIFGSTGSGKTVALTSIAYNSLVHGSGFIYVDGKGDNSLFANVFSMTRTMGREDDMLLINFMTGARDIMGPQEKRLSNTMNPFSDGSSSMLSQLIVSLLGDSGQGGDGDMWKGRAISFVEALMKVLVYARDQEMILLDVNTIRNYFVLERIEPMAIDKVLVRDNQEPASLEHAPDVVLEPIYNYVVNLPGYDKSRKGKQVSQVLEQHGFITMQLTRAFSSLADSYGHILRTKLAEVDMRDVVLNRRILIVLLPALEKSPEELSNLGKIIIATLKVMMAAGLGDAVEGLYRDVISRKPTTAPTPYVCILDEYGYYAVKGFAVVPAQARSLGFSTIFAGQDLPAFQKASKEEAASITANTNIKVAMKLEDPMETWDLFSKTAGESYVTKVDAFQTNASSITNTYLDTRSSSTEKRARIDLLDLKEQREGEAHIFFKSRIVRATMFYANPLPVPFMRLNHFLKVERPSGNQLVELQERFSHFGHVIEQSDFVPTTPLESEEIEVISGSLEANEHMNPIEAGVTALLTYHNRHETADEDQMPTEDTLPPDEMNIFTTMRSNFELDHLVITDDLEHFKRPLLDPKHTHDQAAFVERLTGRSGTHAVNIADEIVKDIRNATNYPPFEKVLLSHEDTADLINFLSQHIVNVVAGVEEEETAGGGMDDFDPSDFD